MGKKALTKTAAKAPTKRGAKRRVENTLEIGDEELAHVSLISDVIGTGDTNIRLLSREPSFPPIVDNCVPFKLWMRAYINWLKAENRRTSKTAVAVRMQTAKAEEAEIRVAVQKRELIPMEEAFAYASEIAGFYRTSIDSIPIRVTRDLELRKTVEKECDELLTRAADRLDKLGRAIRVGGLDPETDDEDVSAGVGQGQQAVP